MKRARSEAEAIRSRVRQQEHQAASFQSAGRKSQPWTGPDLKVLEDDTLTLGEMAEKLGRTYKSVSTMRWKMRREWSP